ncbi:10227_t:CDS:2 [Funneliformis caledonium]|uniref:10227_t:CDS:1 n=1 Tax=Funneliformis caledonium TaxID=1117310 RepID=A0A9N9CXZ7_9GLOM|nr:10227_t:CDS:2 [Funneliformis caledonium]
MEYFLLDIYGAFNAIGVGFSYRNTCTRTFRGRTCEVKISEYNYHRLCRKVRARNHNMVNAVYTVGTMQEELERAAETPNAMWGMVRNRVNRRRYMRAAGGLRVVGKRIGIKNNIQVIRFEECFDEYVPYERQEYRSFLTREGKGIITISQNMGYLHGRPLSVTLDENVINRVLDPYIDKFY